MTNPTSEARRKTLYSSLAWVMVVAFLAPAPALHAGIEQTQIQAVKDLASRIFNVPGAIEPGSPCSGNPCSGGTCSQLSSGSPNQKLLARTWYYGWALRNGTAADKQCARNYMGWLFDAQEGSGHYVMANADEILTSSHFQLHAGGMAGAYLFAYTSGVSFGGLQSQDGSVLPRVRKWWLDEKRLWDLLANGSSSIDAPGGRFAASPAPVTSTVNSYRNKIYGQLRNIRPQPVAADWATHRFWTGGWILEELFNRGHNPTQLVAPLAGYTPRVRVRDTLCIYRQGAEWLIYFPKMRGVGGPVFWVQNRSGQPHDSGAYAGTPVDPPVKPANFATLFPTVTCPDCAGLVAGAVSCPASNALSP